MSGKVGDLNEKQEKALDELKRACKDLLTKPKHDDHFCLRFLRARNFHVDAAKNQLEKSLEYRKQHRVDTLLKEWTPNNVGCPAHHCCIQIKRPEVGLRSVGHVTSSPHTIQPYSLINFTPLQAFLRAFPGGTCGFDRQGGCVIIYPFANLTPKNVFTFCRRSEFTKFLFWIMERTDVLAREQTKKLGHHVESHTVVADFEGYDVLVNMQSPTMLSLSKEQTAAYELNYPEHLNYYFVINAPAVFHIFFNMFKPFISERTLSKFTIHGKDSSKWKPALLELIEPSQLPVHYGGTRRGANGDERCSDEIRYIEKLTDEKIDEYWALVPETERFRAVTVGRKGDHEEEFVVEKDKSGLLVEFDTDAHDIGFSLMRRNQIDKEECTEVLPYKRYNAHNGTVVACVRCDQAGIYVLKFDNSYSSYRSKRVSYSVKIIDPNMLNDEMIMVHEP